MTEATTMTQGFNYLGTMPGTVMLSCLTLIQLSLDLLTRKK
jgi:hypothetical protein